MKYSSPDSAEQAGHLQWARRQLLHRGKAVSCPVHSLGGEKKHPGHSRGDTELSCGSVAGQVAQQPHWWHLLHSQPLLHSGKQTGSRPQTGPEKFLCHLLPCPSTQLPESRGRGLSESFIISLGTGTHSQGHYLKWNKTTTTTATKLSRLQISSISQTWEVRRVKALR